MIHRKYFFDSVRADLFGSLSQGQVDGLNLFLDWHDTQNPEIPDKYHLDDRSFAYVLATTFHETAATMQPIKEYGSASYLKSKPYYPYYGRGYVQLTWKDNYAVQDEKLGLGGKLVAEPDLALDADIALKVLLGGMCDGDFTGKKLGDYFTYNLTDWVDARRIVNGTDRAQDIANYAILFSDAITYV
jgi:putative chitinase